MVALLPMVAAVAVAAVVMARQEGPAVVAEVDGLTYGLGASGSARRVTRVEQTREANMVVVVAVLVVLAVVMATTPAAQG